MDFRDNLSFFHNNLSRELNTIQRVTKTSLLILLGSFFVNNAFAQLRLLPMEHYYKDRAFSVTLERDTNDLVKNKVGNFGGFFPAFESQTYQTSELSAAKNRSTWFGRKLFDEHFFEYKNNEFFITFDILADLSLGRDLRDPKDKNYFFNTRGVHVNGGIGKYFGFFSNLRENQARFLDYQVKELRKGGNVSTNNSGNTNQSGTFISGGNRTKAFKEDAFDFAYVTGGLLFQPSKNIIFTFGNNPIFIGAGHRSLFYSDHSNMFPHLRMSWAISSKINAEIVYGQHLNLIRMTLNTPGTERLYEKKGYTMKFINFTPFKSLQLSIFEGTTWLRYDTNNVGRVDALYYNPLPFINPVVQGLQATRNHTIIGAQGIWSPWQSLHIYSQIASNNLDKFVPSLQLGMRLSEPFKIRDLHLLVEANRIPETMYRHDNPRLNYINNNMALAHPIGAGIDEIVGRVSYEWKRIGFNLQANAIRTVQNTQNEVNGLSLAPLPLPSNANYREAIIGFGQFDLLYRFNKRSNLQLFATALYRLERVAGVDHETLYFGFGMRTPLSNRYFDL
jgi:hypothetical protein